MTIYIILFLIIAAFLFAYLYPAFGNKPNNEIKSTYSSSPHIKDGLFRNLIATKMDFSSNDNYISDFITKHSFSKIPKVCLTNIKFDKSKFNESKDDLVAWFGHSTILFKLDGKSILVDPVFHRASPFPFLLGPAPFKFENEQSVHDLPNEIDFVVITHDHYDHLDYRTIRRIQNNVGKFLVPLGVKAHLLRWGVPINKIIEFDWYDLKAIEQLEFIFTPSRHFSGRTIRDRFATQWGGWIIRNKSTNLYISGDGGYSEEFNNIGEKYGPFDLAFIENGAYNPRWHNVHLFPEESVQASIDLNANYTMPIHWGKFNLSFHTWTEPIERFMVNANKKDLQIITPKIGQIFLLNKEFPIEKWWEGLE